VLTPVPETNGNYATRPSRATHPQATLTHCETCDGLLGGLDHEFYCLRDSPARFVLIDNLSEKRTFPRHLISVRTR
jgi:hypothetical protein